MFNYTLRTLLIVFSATALFWSCGSAPADNQQTSSSEDMGQFADEEEFKASHTGPIPANPEGLGEMIQFPTPDGKQGSAYALRTEAASDKYLFVIHEWWGLNDNIKAQSEKYFEELEGVNVLALDLYDGKVTDDPEQAGQYMQAVEEERARAIINGALSMAGEEAEIATVGWCFGGGWSLNASIMAKDQAVGCVMYYGMPVQTADALAPLQAEILGIFAKQDQWINPEVVSRFEDLAKATGKDLEVHQFDADHAFANPSNPNFNSEAAREAQALTLQFLKNKFS